MCPNCNSKETFWLRGAILEGARGCTKCKTTFDNSEVFTNHDIEQLKESYPNIRLTDEGFLVIYE